MERLKNGIKSISDVLKANRQATIELVKKLGGTITFAKWDEEEGVYKAVYGENTDDVLFACPWVRYDNGNEIVPLLVVAIRFRDEEGVFCGLEILATENIDEVGDGCWFSLSWLDDISEWRIFDTIGQIDFE
jgi:hypothetical protein